MTNRKEEFLSSEDLELRGMSDEEIDRLFVFWLRQAQNTNDHDRDRYSHGVMINVVEPGDSLPMGNR